MTRSEFQVEKTAIGLQYVIPGTNRIVKPKPRAFKADWTPAGDQLVIPGAEKISTVEYVARLTEKWSLCATNWRPSSPSPNRRGILRNS